MIAQFEGETRQDAIFNHYGLDIEQEESFLAFIEASGHSVESDDDTITHLHTLWYNGAKPTPATPADWIPEDEFQANVNLLNEVLRERKRQHGKWGQRHHAPPLYAMILNEEIGEVNKEVCEYAFTKADEAKRVEIATRLRTELIQSAAVIIAMLSVMDKYETYTTKTAPADSARYAGVMEGHDERV